MTDTHTEHTPGPWVAEYQGFSMVGHSRILSADKRIVASEVMLREDAALIASAPQLKAERDELIGFLEDEAQLIAYDDDTTFDDLCIAVGEFQRRTQVLLDRIT